MEDWRYNAVRNGDEMMLMDRKDRVVGVGLGVAPLLTDRAMVQRGEESGEINEASLVADAYTSPNALESHDDRPRVSVTNAPSLPKILFVLRHTTRTTFAQCSGPSRRVDRWSRRCTWSQIYQYRLAGYTADLAFMWPISTPLTQPHSPGTGPGERVTIQRFYYSNLPALFISSAS